jgi:dTDP-glucose 4,6-dehydratase
MRLLVTGGCGFIGSNFARWVLAHQPQVHVTNLDALTYAGNPANLADWDGHARYRFVHGSITDAELVDGLMRETDAVVNFAAESHVDRSIVGAGAFIDANVTGANTLFEAARRHEVGRFVHISTDEVYGSIAEPGRCAEGDALAPNSPYSASKASADLLARAYRETYGYPITITRTTNNFGPYHYPEKVVPLFLTNLMDGGNVPLYGDGANVRDWTYVVDNCAAQWLALTHGTPGAVYNVGAGNEMSNRELTHKILARFGLTGAAADARIDFVADRPGHDRRYAVDTRRIAALGWQPQHTFDEALDATIAWYRQHEGWWRPLKAAGASQRRGLVGQRRQGGA